ncbi:16879_t:CDS:10 [Entrophospora sp. SA101]|nr:16879_t:CDS:10 [Entrophospora sp. SA101]
MEVNNNKSFGERASAYFGRLFDFKSDRHDFLAAAAEFLGTFYFLFMGSGGAVSVGTLGPTVAVIGIPFAFGFSLLVSVWAWASVSGGVLNPAITIALVLTEDVPLVRGILYIIAQFAGAALGSFVVASCQPGDAGAATTLAPGVSAAQGFFLELFATSVLTMSVYMLAVQKHGQFTAPVAIGLSLFISAICIGPYTGASLNPARTFGTAVVTGEYGDSHWIYYIGTIAGSLLAALYTFSLRQMDYKKCMGISCGECGSTQSDNHSHKDKKQFEEAKNDTNISSAGPSSPSPPNPIYKRATEYIFGLENTKTTFDQNELLLSLQKQQNHQLQLQLQKQKEVRKCFNCDSPDHKEKESLVSIFKPGIISDVLKDALGILAPNMEPPYYERMRIYGYPPGYLGYEVGEGKTPPNDYDLEPGEIYESPSSITTEKDKEIIVTNDDNLDVDYKKKKERKVQLVYYPDLNLELTSSSTTSSKSITYHNNDNNATIIKDDDDIKLATTIKLTTSSSLTKESIKTKIGSKIIIIDNNDNDDDNDTMNLSD